MFVRPSLVGGTLRRSNWKTIEESSYFVLQQRGGNNNATTQQNNNNNNKRRQHYTEYRIITKGFPHYRVSDHDDLNLIKDAFDILHQEVLPEVEGKKTSKKILKQLKSWCAKNESLPFDEDGDEDGDGYATDTSITPENSSNEMEDQDNDNYQLISPEVSNSSSSSTKSENAANKGKSKMISVGEDHDLTQSPEQLDFNNSDYSEDMQSSDGSDNEGVTGGAHHSGPAGNEWITLGSSVLDSLMGWFEGPPIESVAVVATTSSSKQVNVNASSNNKNQTILDIPMQFIDLLTYPEIDPKASKKASFAVLREISFVKQRRKVLFLLTLYMFLIRLCSFDLFLVLLFVSNCAMLFLMKNSGKVNVTMAKRAVRQRIGWAKQWAGSLFKNRTNNNISQNIAGPNNNRKTISNNVNSNGTVNISSNAYVNVNTNIGVVGGVKTSPTPIQTTNMAKSASQDMLQSGSMSDTTHGGNVSTKIITPKRGVFFRKSGTTSQTSIKEDKIITETSSITGSSPQKSSDFPPNSNSSTTTGTNSPNLNPQLSLQISGGGNVNETSQPLNTAIIQQQSSQSPTTKRRFFKRNNNNNNNNNNNISNYTSSNNFTLPNIVPTSPLQNGIITTTLPSENLNDSFTNYKSLSMSNVPTVTGGIIGNSTATNGIEVSNGNEGLMVHSIKYSSNINMTSNNQQSSSSNSLSAVDNDFPINDTYYEGEILKKILLGDLKVK